MTNEERLKQKHQKAMQEFVETIEAFEAKYAKEDTAEADERNRQADKAHRARVLRESWEDLNKRLFPNYGERMDCTDVGDILNAILDGKIRHVTINF